MTRTEHWEIESRNAGDVEMSEDEDGGCRVVFNVPGEYFVRGDGYDPTRVWVLPFPDPYEGRMPGVCQSIVAKSPVTIAAR